MEKIIYTANVSYIDKAKSHAFKIGGDIKNHILLSELFVLLKNIANARLRYIKLALRENGRSLLVPVISKVKKELTGDS